MKKIQIFIYLKINNIINGSVSTHPKRTISINKTDLNIPSSLLRLKIDDAQLIPWATELTAEFSRRNLSNPKVISPTGVNKHTTLAVIKVMIKYTQKVRALSRHERILTQKAKGIVAKENAVPVDIIKKVIKQHVSIHVNSHRLERFINFGNVSRSNPGIMKQYWGLIDIGITRTTINEINKGRY